MGTVTKWAVETAKDQMNAAINVKLARFDKENPTKARKFTRRELAEIAVADPAWQKHVLSRAGRGYSDVDIQTYDLEANSPLVAAAIKKNEAVDAPRNKAREKLNADLCERREWILRTAIIGGTSGEELLKVVNEFCKA